MMRTANESVEAAKDLARNGLSSAQTSQSIEWYAEGQARTVEVSGVRVTIRFIGRKGRRGRIAIEAPAGAVFRTNEGSETCRTPGSCT